MHFDLDQTALGQDAQDKAAANPVIMLTPIQ